jgi:hypothetical protein
VGLRFSRLVVAMMLLLVLTFVYCGNSLFVQDLAYTRAQTELSFWGRGNYQPTPQVVRDTSQTLDALLESAPRHPEYLELHALYSAWQAYWTQDLLARDTLNGQAAARQYRALMSRPAHRQGWSKMVEYASRVSTGESMFQLAQDRLVSLQPPGKPERAVR